MVVVTGVVVFVVIIVVVVMVVMILVVMVVLVIVVLVIVTLQLRIVVSKKARKIHVTRAFDFGKLKDCGSGDVDGGGGDGSDC